MNIYEKLLTMQVELKAPKNMYNSFGKYKYRNAESILEAVKPLADKYKAVLIAFDTIEDRANGTYITAHARLIDAEKPDDVIEVTASAREADQKKGMDTMQITGCASSYARKYALNGLFCIDDTQDSDSLPPDNVRESKPRRQEQQTEQICGHCKKPIVPHVHKGETYSAQRICENTIKLFNMPLCWECMMKAKRKNEEETK